MLDAEALIEKHRAKGVLVDTNLLVLLLVGEVNTRRIAAHKRTHNFTIDDFDLLKRLVDWFGRLIVTPHVLAQVSDLADLHGRERHDTSKELVAHPMFDRFGLTDAAIATVCSREILVLTADVSLQLALQSRGADALNFNHVRQLAWD